MGFENKVAHPEFCGLLSQRIRAIAVDPAVWDQRGLILAVGDMNAPSEMHQGIATA